MCPVAGRLIGVPPPAKVCCHVLVIETDGGVVLVDTGFGTADVADPRRLPRALRAITRPALDPSETALARVTALGLAPRDVRAIVCTHLDLDHAGGLADFPDASVHVMTDEHQGATTRPTFLERHRYLPAQLAHGPRWVLHRANGDGETWRGFDAVRALGPEFGAEILLLPLGGHTRGHAGVAVRHERGWILHAGDAYFHRDELALDPDVPVGLSAYQRLIAYDDSLRRANQERLRMLARDAASNDLRVICAHDPVELERAQAARFSATPAPVQGVD